MRATPTFLALAVVFGVGCVNSTGPSGMVVGTYVLVTVDGSVLPFQSSHRSYPDTLYGQPVSVEETEELLSDTLRLDAYLTYSQTSTLRLTEVATLQSTGETVDSNVITRSVTYTGGMALAVHSTPAKVVINFVADPRGNMWTGTLVDDVLTVTLSGVEYVYER